MQSITTTKHMEVKMNRETIEEAAEKVAKLKYGATIYGLERVNAFKDGAKWQAERMYSEEDLLSAFEAGMMFIGEDKGSFREWFEQFKKEGNND